MSYIDLVQFAPQGLDPNLRSVLAQQEADPLTQRVRQIVDSYMQTMRADTTSQHEMWRHLRDFLAEKIPEVPQEKSQDVTVRVVVDAAPPPPKRREPPRRPAPKLEKAPRPSAPPAKEDLPPKYGTKAYIDPKGNRSNFN